MSLCLIQAAGLRYMPDLTLRRCFALRYGVPEGTKVFIIIGKCYRNVREALVKRGWAENPQIESRCFHFKWTLKVLWRCGQLNFTYCVHHTIHGCERASAQRTEIQALNPRLPW